MKRGVCFISSTGGHLSQIRQLLSVFNNEDACLITEGNQTSSKNSIRTFYLRQQDRKKITFPIVVLLNIFLSMYFYFKIKPKVIISTGAGAVIPFCFIGKVFGSKIIFIESFAKINSPTITGRIIYKIADSFYIQWEELREYYPNSIYKGTIY